MKPNKKLLEAAVSRHKSVAENPADLARRFLKSKTVRKRGGAEAEQVMNNIFLSKLPESVADDSSLGKPNFGRVVSRVYDGDFCQTRDEAYQKFRERQEMAQAVLQG